MPSFLSCVSFRAASNSTDEPTPSAPSKGSFSHFNSVLNSKLSKGAEGDEKSKSADLGDLTPAVNLNNLLMSGEDVNDALELNDYILFYMGDILSNINKSSNTKIAMENIFQVRVWREEGESSYLVERFRKCVGCLSDSHLLSIEWRPEFRLS